MTYTDDPRRTDILNSHAIFMTTHPEYARRQEASKVAPTTVQPVRDPSRFYYVTANDLFDVETVCKTCGGPARSINFRPRPGHLVPRFDDLPADIVTVLKTRQGWGSEIVTVCDRCQMMNATPWLKVGWSNLTERVVGSTHVAALQAVAARLNRPSDRFYTPQGALFSVGRVAVAFDVFETMPGGIRAIETSYLHRHVSGDFGSVGTYSSGLSSDPRKGLIADLVIRNARAIDSGSGLVVSRYSDGSKMVVVRTILSTESDRTLTSVVFDR